MKRTYKNDAYKKKAFKDDSLNALNAPEVGFEPTTNGLTVHCSTAELFRIRKLLSYLFMKFRATPSFHNFMKENLKPIWSII